MWGKRRYNSLDYYLKEQFGEKLYKLSLNGGMTCPNRDGRLGRGGCIFCSGGSGDFASPPGDMGMQIEKARELISGKYSGNRFIAYFGSYTNTYADAGYLRRLFYDVIEREETAVLDIATRPDCLEPEKLSLIGELCRIKPVWIELGLQTCDDATARLINRGYPTEVYDRAVSELKKTGVHIITHMIAGLPGEKEEDMLRTARHIAAAGSDGIKIQLLHILRGTALEKMYDEGRLRVMTEEEYVSAAVRLISVLPEEMVIHRLTGDGDKKILKAPLWSCNKRRVLNLINHRLKEENILQGCNAP